jgi:type IV secretory pathway VirB9-like protein
MSHKASARFAGFALIAAIAAGFTPAMAQEVVFRNGYSEIMYQDDDIYTLGVKVGYKLVIYFPEGEDIKRAEPGIKGSVLETKFGRNWVSVRPTQEKVDTNIHIMTEQDLGREKVGRAYTFVLKEGSGKIHQRVMVLRPDMDDDPEPAVLSASASQPVTAAPAAAKAAPAAAQLQKPAAPAPAVVNGRQVPVDDLGGDGRSGSFAPQAPGIAPKMVASLGVPGAELVRNLDGGYTIKNQRPRVFEVDKVFNDGERTFVIFKSLLNEAPLFFRITENGKREVLTYRIEPAKDPRDRDIFIIPRLIDVGIVKVGDTESKFVWSKMKS